MTAPVRDWRHQAACISVDPELFFPIGALGPAVRQSDDARSICARCTVRNECLGWAMEQGMDHGVWGGLTEEERRSLRRGQARSSRR